MTYVLEIDRDLQQVVVEKLRARMVAYVLGIDPGLDGALSLVRKKGPLETELLAVWDMPTTEVKGKRCIDIGKLWGLLLEEVGEFRRHDLHTVIEQVRAMPRQMGGKEVKMGAQSSFNFGEGFGIVRALAHVFRVGSVKTVEARAWKLRAGLIGEPKEAALDKVLSLYPTESMLFTPKRGRLRKVNAIGRADATLIATYGYRPNFEDLI